MCIFVASTEHNKFPLILIDNRDEAFARPTAPAYWWKGTPILAPRDLESPSRGTWIGVTKGGRFAVLVNAFDEEKKKSKKSRGCLTRLYLESHLQPKAWIKWLQTEKKDLMTDSGGFTLLVGIYDPLSSPKAQYEFVSNHEIDVPQPSETFALSNGNISDPTWTKTAKAMALFVPLLSVTDRDELTEKCFELLSHREPFPPLKRNSLREHIFIPALPLNGSLYGTRTQIVIIIDNEGYLHFTQKDRLPDRVSSYTFRVLCD